VRTGINARGNQCRGGKSAVANYVNGPTSFGRGRSGDYLLGLAHEAKNLRARCPLGKRTESLAP
jgi:hypothetical protein